MKKAFLFPGQGSQFIGMGQELASQFEVAKDVFSEVDEALGERLSALMFRGDIEQSNYRDGVWRLPAFPRRVARQAREVFGGGMLSVQGNHFTGDGRFIKTRVYDARADPDVL